MRALTFLFKFSYRNLWRSPKRTAIMLMSLSLGTAFIVWDLHFASSGSKEVMNEFLSQYAGNYQISHPDYYPNKINRKEFNNFKTITDDLIQDSSLLEISTQRVTAPVFVSGEKKTLGVLLTGLDVAKELTLSTLHKVVNEGRFLDATGEREVILGKKLAKRIDVKLGDEIVVIGQALDGSVANDLMKVVGLLDFGGGDLEEALAFTQISTTRTLMVMDPAAYHQRVSFDMTNEELPEVPGAAVVSWTEILPEISVSIKFIDKFTWLVSVVIVLVISLGLSNTLMITFFEREKEFQSLNIIGARTSWITKALMIEVFMMGTLAIFVGMILGYAVTAYCTYHPINIQLFTNGKPIIMGGMLIQPLVRLQHIASLYWQVPLLIYFFLGLTMIYPLIRVIQRSRNAI